MLSTCANVSARKAPGFWAAQCRRTTASPEFRPMCHRLSLPRPSEVPRKRMVRRDTGASVSNRAAQAPDTSDNPGSPRLKRAPATCSRRPRTRRSGAPGRPAAAARARVGARRGCGVAQRECRRVHARQRAQRLPSDRVRESASGRTRRLRIQCSAKHTPPAPRSGLRVHFGSYKTHGRRQFHAR